MFGLVVLLIMFGYLAVAVTATVLTVRSVKRAGGSRRDQWKRGGFVALIFYLIPFWDAIPLWVVFHYKCKSEAALVVTKTASQWVRENSPDESSLIAVELRNRWINMDGKSRRRIGERLAVDLFDSKSVTLSLSKKRIQVIDLKSGEILIDFTDFMSGGSFAVGGLEGLKVWNMRNTCSAEVDGESSKFSLLAREFEDLERRKK